MSKINILIKWMYNFIHSKLNLETVYMGKSWKAILSLELIFKECLCEEKLSLLAGWPSFAS